MATKKPNGHKAACGCPICANMKKAKKATAKRKATTKKPAAKKPAKRKASTKKPAAEKKTSTATGRTRKANPATRKTPARKTTAKKKTGAKRRTARRPSVGAVENGRFYVLHLKDGSHVAAIRQFTSRAEAEAYASNLKGGESRVFENVVRFS